MRPTLLTLLLFACGGQTGENSIERCEGMRFTDVDATDTSLGFSAEDVVAGLTDYTLVQWTGGKGEGAPAEDVLSLTDLRIDGQVRIADPSEVRAGCPVTTEELVIPLHVTIDVGAGGVGAEGIVELWASGAAPAEVESLGPPTWGDLPATLSGPYEDSFDTWWADRQAAHPTATDWEIEAIDASLYGPWDALEVGVSVLHQSSESSSATALWSGDAANPTP